MTLTQLKNKANIKLSEFWDALIIKQEAYFLKHNKFFQLLITDPVIDGVDTTWVLEHPYDEPHAIDVDFEFNSPVPFQISIDEWVGNDKGFTATAVIELPNGNRYTRSRTAVPTVQEATYEPHEPGETPVLITPKTITDWTINTTAWTLVEEHIPA
jgi:hypothetical protein